MFGEVLEWELVLGGLGLAGSAVGKRGVFGIGYFEVVGSRCGCGSIEGFDAG